MRTRIKEVVIKRLKLTDSWVICFVLGFIMMNYPFISIFNKPIRPFDIPLLYLYLLLGWVFSIFIVFLFSRAERHDSTPKDHR